MNGVGCPEDPGCRRGRRRTPGGPVWYDGEADVESWRAGERGRVSGRRPGCRSDTHVPASGVGRGGWWTGRRLRCGTWAGTPRTGRNWSVYGTRDQTPDTKEGLRWRKVPLKSKNRYLFDEDPSSCGPQGSRGGAGGPSRRTRRDEGGRRCRHYVCGGCKWFTRLV